MAGKKEWNPNHAEMFDRGMKDGKASLAQAQPPLSDNKFYLQGYLYGRFKNGFRVIPVKKGDKA